MIRVIVPPGAEAELSGPGGSTHLVEGPFEFVQDEITMDGVLYKTGEWIILPGGVAQKRSDYSREDYSAFMLCFVLVVALSASWLRQSISRL